MIANVSITSRPRVETELRASGRRIRLAWLAPALALLALSLPAEGSASPAEAPAPPAEAEALRALEPYVGSWIADERETPEGRGFRFGYELHWFDEGRSILEMKVTQEFDDGEVTVLWEGFKGWDPSRGITYYYGFSPSGRLAYGEVHTDGDVLHTEYTGVDAQGNAVQIRDTFTSGGPDSFRNETYMHRDGEWKKIWNDEWRRRLDS